MCIAQATIGPLHAAEVLITAQGERHCESGRYVRERRPAACVLLHLYKLRAPLRRSLLWKGSACIPPYLVFRTDSDSMKMIVSGVVELIRNCGP